MPLFVAVVHALNATAHALNATAHAFNAATHAFNATAHAFYAAAHAFNDTAHAFSCYSDYRANVTLDTYDADNIDDGQFSELSMGDRVAVDRMLERRDRQRAIASGRVPAAFLGGIVEGVFFLHCRIHVALLLLFYSYCCRCCSDRLAVDDDEMGLARMPRRRRRRGPGDQMDDMDDETYDPNVLVCMSVCASFACEKTSTLM